MIIKSDEPSAQGTVGTDERHINFKKFVYIIDAIIIINSDEVNEIQLKSKHAISLSKSPRSSERKSRETGQNVENAAFC